MPFPAMPTQVTCPKCQQVFVTQVRTIIDIGEEPELKEEFLRGRVNYAQCPQCQTGGMLSTPLLYHDPNRELLVAYVPPQLGLSADQQEQFMGSLVNAVMNQLPTERRKGYFLQPKSVLTMEGLYDAILEADGFSREVLEAQRGRIRLVNTLLAAVDDEKTLSQLAEEHRQELDYDFYLMLSHSIEAHEQDGDQERADALTRLREKLLARGGPPVPSAGTPAGSYDELIEMLDGMPVGERWRAAVVANRQRLDYGFFQALTARIEAAQSAGDREGDQRLTELRKRVLDELDAQDRLARNAEDQASLLIMKLAEAQDVAAAVREHESEINEVFVGMLARYRAMAETQKDTSRAERLSAILEATLDILEEKLPAEVRFVNRLLRSGYPDGTDAVLEKHRGLLSDAFLKTYDQYIASLEQSPDKDLAEHLRQVRAQIVAKLTILRA